ncbi:MAG TPA: hypothetical protein ENN20_10880 [Candidatus Marinimicrobia bacterium]|nr:hypothetical protein [Candidatus Neomarinimicrobiota bacterium]
MDHHNSRKIAFSGIYIALLLGIGYALAYVPNIELVTALIFCAGVLMGYKQGLIVGLIGEFLFSALNPMGSGLLFPPMLLAQLLAMAFVAFSGALLRRFILNASPGLRASLITGGSGFLVTFLFDVLVSAAYPVSAGFPLRETGITIFAGLAFSIIHLISNTLVFMTLVPLICQQVYRAIPFFADYFPVMSITGNNDAD